MTLLGRNLIWREIRATASACSSVACSSPQNACAAEVRSSIGIWRHIRAGRISSVDIAPVYNSRMSGPLNFFDQVTQYFNEAAKFTEYPQGLLEQIRVCN